MKKQKITSIVMIVCLMFLNCTSITSTAATADTVKDTIDFIEVETSDYERTKGSTTISGDQGKGNATLIQSNGKYALIDTGTDNDTKSVENDEDAKKAGKVYKYLHDTLGKKKLEFIILTHMDNDHAGGAVRLINSKFCNEKTKIYIKTVTENSEKTEQKNSLKNYTNIIAAAKQKKMSIVKVIPVAKPSGIKTAEDLKAKLESSAGNDLLKTKLDTYSPDGSSYVKKDQSSSIKMGNYELTLYNGNNWNTQGFIIDKITGKDEAEKIDKKKKAWDENVNSITVLIKRSGTNLTTYRTYLGSDLGENTVGHGDYSRIIAEKAAKVMGSAVTVYQVAHHGYYNSLNKETAKSLNCKYAIVTESFKTIMDKGELQYGKNSTTASNTLTALKESTRLETIFFTGGTYFGSQLEDKRLASLKCDNKLNKLKGKTNGVQQGNVYVKFGSSSLDISQGSK